MNAREGDGDANSPATDKQSKDDDGNRWWLGSSDSVILPAPFFSELDTLINWVTLKKKIIEYKTRRKKERKKDRRCTRSFPLASFSLASYPSTPSAYRLSASLIPVSEPAADRRHETRQCQGGGIRGERGQGAIGGLEELGELLFLLEDIQVHFPISPMKTRRYITL